MRQAYLKEGDIQFALLFPKGMFTVYLRTLAVQLTCRRHMASYHFVCWIRDLIVEKQTACDSHCTCRLKILAWRDMKTLL